jgi:hypothetical protein
MAQTHVKLNNYTFTDYFNKCSNRTQSEMYPSGNVSSPDTTERFKIKFHTDADNKYRELLQL